MKNITKAELSEEVFLLKARVESLQKANTAGDKAFHQLQSDLQKANERIASTMIKNAEQAQDLHHKQMQIDAKADQIALLHQDLEAERSRTVNRLGHFVKSLG